MLNEKTAQRSGETYSATLQLWGWYDSLSVKPVIERIGKATYESQVSAERLSIAAPDKAEPVITRDLPNQAIYLVLICLGLEQYGSGNLTEALRMFDAIVTAAAPEQISLQNRSEVYFWRGNAHYDKGDIERAIADYTQAIKLSTTLLTTSRMTAEFYQALHRDSAFVFYNRGNAYYLKGDTDHAIADYTQAIMLKPDDAFAYNNRGVAYDYKGESDSAIEDTTQAIKLKADFAAAYSNRGVAYKAKGDKEKAIADFKKTLELGTDPTLHAKAAEALKELGARP